MPLYLIADALDAYEAEQAARLALVTRYEIALNQGDELDILRVEALIAAHDLRHGTQLTADLAA